MNLTRTLSGFKRRQGGKARALTALNCSSDCRGISGPGWPAVSRNGTWSRCGGSVCSGQFRRRYLCGIRAIRRARCFAGFDGIIPSPVCPNQEMALRAVNTPGTIVPKPFGSSIFAKSWTLPAS
jgi:hypothetical protein